MSNELNFHDAMHDGSIIKIGKQLIPLGHQLLIIQIYQSYLFCLETVIIFNNLVRTSRSPTIF